VKNSSQTLWVFPVVFLLALAVFAFGVYLAATQQEFSVLAAGCVCVVVALASWPIIMALALAQDSAQETARQAIKPVEDRLESLSILLNLISEQQLISDRAKIVAFRAKDRETLRYAIHEEINRQDWEAAMVLANEMESLFGYKQEADRLRQEIEERRNAVVQKQIADATSLIERHVRGEQWTLAHQEADRLAALFPNSDQVRSLHGQIELRRQQRKQQLIDDWNTALQRKDVDGSLSLLKTLDLYLTPAEAEGLQEAARGVIREKLGKLRAQFALSVQDHDWNEAIRVGEILIRDFPNTQMAKEVREKMETLRLRASAPESAGV
jgi:hypothetical protein